MRTIASRLATTTRERAEAIVLSARLPGRAAHVIDILGELPPNLSRWGKNPWTVNFEREPL